jgi:hypothetical protein
MSIESRLLKGHDPKDVAKLFGVAVESLPKIGSNAQKAKAVKKTPAKSKA